MIFPQGIYKKNQIIGLMSYFIRWIVLYKE